MSDAEMVYLTNINGLNVYVADNTFEKPGLWYWDGKRNVHPVSEIDRLTAQLAEAKTSIAKQVEAKDKACAALMNQLAEAKASAEAWQENCHITERELEKERDKHADLIGKLAERDGAITCYNEVLAELREGNASLREEVERLNDKNRELLTRIACLKGAKNFYESECHKQTAQEIVEQLYRWGYVVEDAEVAWIMTRFGLDG